MFRHCSSGVYPFCITFKIGDYPLLKKFPWHHIWLALISACEFFGFLFSSHCHYFLQLMGFQIKNLNSFSNSMTLLQVLFFRFMYMLIKKQMRKMGDYFGINPILELKKEEMAWLGLSAYIWVLKKKQARHKHLLSLLKFKISAYGRMDEASDSLKHAVDDSHSSVFKHIRF